MLPAGALSSFNMIEKYYVVPKRFEQQLKSYNKLYARSDEYFCMELYIAQVRETCKEYLF